MSYEKWAYKACKSDLDLFAVEGGTAAMAYIFNSLKENKIIKTATVLPLVALFSRHIWKFQNLMTTSLKKYLLRQTLNSAGNIQSQNLES